MRKSLIASVCVLALAGLGLSACSGSTSSSSASASASSSAAATVKTIEKVPSQIDGKPVTVPEKRDISFKVDGDASAWKATIEDPSVVEFVAGSSSKAPGLHPLKAGKTKVELMDAAGKTYTFALTVTAGER